MTLRTNLSNTSRNAAFTLLELLLVISIVGLIAAIALPTINNFKPDVAAVATRRLLDDIGRARQLAISQRTTVYMVFVPTNYWNDTAYSSLPTAELNKAQKLYDKQLIGYTFVSLRSVGDQPGRPTARYWSGWKTLPPGAFVPLQKFEPRTVTSLPVLNIFTNGSSLPAFQIFGFSFSDANTPIPFPSELTPRSANPNRPYVSLPYIAFDYMGQLTSGRNELIPIAKGSVVISRDPLTKAPRPQPPSLQEIPPGNSTNGFNVVSIDPFTGRAHVERREIQ